jgi:1-acyl-sn-glycerol-3-phosphate acyltransferase
LTPPRQILGAVGERISRAEADWRAHGTPYELVRLFTAPARRGLVRLHVENAQRLPVDGPVIVVANHVSFFDSVLLMFSLPRPVSFIGKAEYTDNPVTNWLFRGAGMIPVRRESPGDLAHVFDEVAEVLESGEVIGIFPEGTRSRDGLLHRGHVGAAHLAIATGTPIVPVGLIGTDRVLPTGARLVRPFRHVTITVGEPIDVRSLGFAKSTNRTRRELTDRFMVEIGRLCEERYVDAYAPTPAHHSG